MAAPPSATWRMLSHPAGHVETPQGIDAAWETVSGMIRGLAPRTRRFTAMAEQVCALDEHYSAMTDAALREAAEKMRERVRLGRDKEADLIHGFAIVREVVVRQLEIKPYPVQVAGALALAHKCIVEMATGEGKTVTATMPAVFAGWRGRGCHVITVNDYLAQRDAEWMSGVYRFCGLTVACVTQDDEPPARKAAYDADITYTTNKEVAADFLRDRLTLGDVQTLPSALLASITEQTRLDRVVQRGLAHAIVDEADSVLIDEAVTPLIISGPSPSAEQVEAYQQAAEMAQKLEIDVDYRARPRYREVELTPKGSKRIDELSEPLGGIWAGVRRREEIVVQALTVREFYACELQYVIQEDKVVIVDEFTGRLMPDREWRDGIHQAVEAKEGLTVNPPKETYARVSFQRFFRLYKALAGMTGTALEAKGEFWQIYHLPVVTIPTHRPCIREQLPDRVFRAEADKWQAIVEDIARLHAVGRPILVGTRSVAASEKLATMLAERNMDCQVLNAVRHAEEAQIVAEAGQVGRITVATNMAGRGTDIKLGSGAADLGGLHVIATERHESGRVDRQLYGRAGRQGDSGSAQAFVSLEDELIVRHARHTAAVVGPRKWVFDRAQDHAQNAARRQRRGVLKSDDWLDEYLGFAGSER